MPLLLLTECGVAFERELDKYLEVSGWPARFKPVEHGTDEYWHDFLGGGPHAANTRTGLASVALKAVHAGEPDQWLDHIVRGALERILSCWSRGGRFWEAELWTSQYGLSGIPPLLRTSICSPVICEGHKLQAEVIPRYFGHVLYGASLPAPFPGHSSAQELTIWDHVSLDFVLAGVGGCGTTSLRRNLGRHPDIGFTNGSLFADEDFFLFSTRRSLPLREQADVLNGLWSDRARPRPRVLGLYNALLWREQAVRRALADVPHLKVIVVVCDPLGRFELAFWQTMCTGAADGVDEPLPCVQHMEEVLSRGLDSLGLGLSVTGHLQALRRLFGERLLVVHQETLRRAPRAVYDGIAKFLGASGAFPARAVFPRYNAQRGMRSGLCHNKSLVVRMQRRLRGEYSAIREALNAARMTLVEALLYRTRCDRPGELKVPSRSCSGKVRCSE